MNSLKIFIRQAEDSRKLPPAEKDIAEAEVVLRDFGIHIPIPKFNTVAELDRWKHDMLINN